MLVKLLKGFSGVWFVLFLLSIAASGLGIILKAPSLLAAVRELWRIWSPTNSINFWVVCLAVSPSVGAFYLAERIEAKRRDY